MKCEPGCTCGKHRRRAKTTSEPGADPAPAIPAEQPKPEEAKPDTLIYYERGHRYYLNGKRAKGASTISKIAGDDYMIRLWHERMVAIGVTIDPNLRENVATHVENRNMLEELCEQAKKVAKANLAADRGSQKHRVLELILKGEEHKLITEQQKRDAQILKRTMDRFKLVPHGDLAEQFIAYPEYTVCGRFDAVLDFERPDGSTVLVDLKSGENAVNYPHSTLVQLATYLDAPLVSAGDVSGDRVEVSTWRSMPDRMDRDRAYVLLVTNDTEVGTLHEFNMEHGRKAARWCMELINWRKEYDYAKSAVREIVYDPLTEYINDRGQTLAEQIASLDSRTALAATWQAAKREGLLTEGVQEALKARAVAIGLTLKQKAS